MNIILKQEKKNKKEKTMANITLGGTPTFTNGSLPELGEKCPDFSLITKDLNTVHLKDFEGKKLVLNIFPSVDTGVCSAAARTFNEHASKYPDTVILCISRDLPFAQARFCSADGIEDVEVLSDFKTGKFGQDYGVEIESGAFAGLLARAVVVTDANHSIVYTELVPEIGQAPDFGSALKALS